ncbi:MAG: PKD domain-containing protein [Cryomorphaceae bacterium]|nr:FG-GAP-like repeat-containing protein [Flavobacteriales bacterium]
MKHVLLTLGGCLTGLALAAQTGAAADYAKISQSAGNFNANLSNQGKFGFVSASRDQRVYSGAPFSGNGEVHITDLNTDGTVASQSLLKADDFEIFSGLSGAEFGTSTTTPGDLNADDKPDFLIGAPGAGESGGLVLLLSTGTGYNAEFLPLPESLLEIGARWGDHLHFKDGTYFAGLASGTGKVVEFTIGNDFAIEVLNVFDQSNGELAGHLEEGDRFGTGISVYDIDGDGIDDILCGAPGDDDGGSNFGAVYQLYRNNDGSIERTVKLSAASGGFNGFLNSDDGFGISIVPLGDLDQDGNPDIAVGAPGDDDGNIDVGAVWIIFLRADGTMKRQRKINLTNGNLEQSGLGLGDRFGTRIASIGDINGDGTTDLAVGVPHDDDGGTDRGAFFTVMIEYCEIPVALFEYESNGPTVTFSIPGGEGFTYIWNFSDGNYSQAENPTHTFASNGVYNVCLTINGPCGGNFYCGNVTVTGAGALNTESTEAAAVEVFPNPATSFVRVKSPREMTAVTLRDLTGKEVWKRNVTGFTTEISVAGLPKGMYILSVRTAVGETASKVQVM